MEPETHYRVHRTGDMYLSWTTSIKDTPSNPTYLDPFYYYYIPIYALVF